MTDIKKTSAEDLAKTIETKREELRAFRFDIAGATKKNVKAPRNARKEIARALTEVSARKNVTA